MRILVWAFAERLAPRVGTALLMLAFAATSSPETVGYYAAAMTGYTILQTITDGAAKRIAVSAVVTKQGVAFLRLYRIWYAVLGTLALLGVIILVWLWGAPASDVLTFTPLLLLPGVMGMRVEALANLQRAGHWRQISVASASSTLVALSVGFPLVLTLHNALGSVVQLVLTETLFAVWLRATAKAKCTPVPLIDTDTDYRSAFWSAGGFIISLQGQYQLDRVLVGAMGGSAALGAFNLGWSLSRSVSDSLSTGTLNVLQSRVMDGQQRSAQEIQRIVMDVLPRALAMASVTVAAVYLAARFVAPWILGEAWTSMLQMVPLMSATALPAICCYCLVSVLMYYQRMSWAIAPRILGLVFSVGVGWAVQYSLEAAVWIAMLREVVSMFVMMIGARQVVSVRMVTLPLGATLVACGAVFVADCLVA